MPAPTLPGPLDGADFTGKTSSVTTLPRAVGSWPTCRHCGSTIYPSRFEGAKVRTVGCAELTVEKYRCRCGRGQEVRRSAA